jgi:hypothetical protein
MGNKLAVMEYLLRIHPSEFLTAHPVAVDLLGTAKVSVARAQRRAQSWINAIFFIVAFVPSTAMTRLSLDSRKI